MQSRSLQIICIILICMLQISTKLAEELKDTVNKRLGRGRGSKWWGLAKASEPNNLLPLSPGMLFMDGAVQTNLKKKQRRLVRQNPGVLNVVASAAKLALSECQYQFRYGRWNCTTRAGINRGKNVFGKIIDKSCPETAFIYALTSAAVTYSVAKACSEGQIETCTCDFKQNSRNRLMLKNKKKFQNKQQYESTDNTTPKVRGCSDNIDFGMHFGREFVDAGETGFSIREKMNLHNNEAGRKLVERELKLVCKCHGVSGACSVETCWMKLPPFRSIGENLKERFEKATRIFINKKKIDEETNSIHTQQRKRKKYLQLRTRIKFLANHIRDSGFSAHFGNKIGNIYSMSKKKKPMTNFQDYDSNIMKPTINDLVYYESSPAFCEYDPALSILGTRGRYCNITSTANDNCEFMCCGRGYRSIEIVIVDGCNCKFQWCCEVLCEPCVVKKTTHYCL